MSGDTKEAVGAITAIESIPRRPVREGNYVVVYSPSSKCRDLTKNNLSALVVTESGDVLGAGVNSLVGGDYRELPMAMGGSFLEDYAKVDVLSGQEIVKIVVSRGFGAALTRSNDAMVWSGSISLGTDDVVAFRGYQPNNKCSEHNSLYSKSSVGGVDLAYCSSCFNYVQFANPNFLAKNFVLYSEEGFKFSCYKCFRPCSTMTLNNIELQYCPKCDLMLEREKLVSDDLELKLPFAVLRKNNETVTDIACTGNYICMLLSDEKVVLRHYHSGQERIVTKLTSDDGTQAYDKMVGLFGVGKRCLFVTTEDGTLYRIMNGLAQSNLEMVAVKLPGAVKKVCCGSETVGVLLADGSVWFILDDCSTSRLCQNSVSNTFTDIAVVGMSNTFLVRANESSLKRVEFSNVKIQVHFSDSELETAILNMVCPKPKPLIPKVNPLLHELKQLYGKPHLADLTIKLADGDFPAHSCILFATSTHFQKAFSAEKPSLKVLDMAEYNPKAYKCLLQYFYQVEPDELDAEDLLDLHQIANSYGETAVADDATAKIKSKLTEENVLQIFTKAKKFKVADVMKDCEKMMRSPSYMEKLLKSALTSN